MKTGLIIGIVVVVVILIVGGILLFGSKGTSPVTTGGNAGGSTGGSTVGSTGGSTSTPQTFHIGIISMTSGFSPSSLTVKAGDTVIWTNQDSVSHTVTSDSGSELGSSTLGSGQTYSHTFNTAGTYAYHCSIHPNMHGTVTAQ